MKKLLALLFVCFAALGATAQPLAIGIDSATFVKQDSLLAGITRPSFHNGDTVTMSGVVTFNPRYSALSSSFKQAFVQMQGTGTWKGVNVRLGNLADSTTTLFFDNFKVGNLVSFTGVVNQFPAGPTGETQIDLLPITTSIVSLQSAPAPIVLPVSDFMLYDAAQQTSVWQPTTGEQYEGSYVQFNNVTVTNVQPQANGRIYWDLQDANGNVISTRDLSAFMRPPYVSSSVSTSPNPNAPIFLQPGTTLSYIRGVIVETDFGTPIVPKYALAILDTNALGAASAVPPAVDSVSINPITPNATQSVVIGAHIVDPDGTVSSAKLYYAVNGAPAYTMVTMTMNYTDHYVATIPAQANNSMVRFYIVATDNSNQSTHAPDSLSYGSPFWVYYVYANGIDSIAKLQKTLFTGPQGFSIYNNQALTGINIQAVAMTSGSSSAANDLGQLYLEDATAKWSGIAIAANETGIAGVNRGDKLKITAATVYEDFGITKLKNISFTTLSSNNPLFAPITTVSADSLIHRRSTYSEPYESMFLRFDSVYVQRANADDSTGNNYGEFSFRRDSVGFYGLRADDVSNDINATFNVDSLTKNMYLPFVQGMLYYSFGNWKLLPRNRNDIGGFHSASAIGRTIAPSEFAIYPNPATSEFQVRMKNVTTGATLQLLDASGRVLNTAAVQNQIATYATENLAPGIYFVRYTTGNASGVQRVVIVR